MWGFFALYTTYESLWTLSFIEGSWWQAVEQVCLLSAAPSLAKFQ